MSGRALHSASAKTVAILNLQRQFFQMLLYSLKMLETHFPEAVRLTCSGRRLSHLRCVLNYAHFQPLQFMGISDGRMVVSCVLTQRRNFDQCARLGV